MRRESQSLQLYVLHYVQADQHGFLTLSTPPIYKQNVCINI